ncbi:MAG: endonuclease/exonuclease/phosphatase family protein [Bdellovibrionales bacterium]|nr:endonuclease/exonuclease/phosphatase family protein [Bdellovibrionales bacterium]
MKYLSLLLALFSLNSYSSDSKYLSLLSYNVGLAHGFVPYAKQRTPKIIEAIKNFPADIICLQEVWKDKDNKKLIRELRKEYPYINFNKVRNIRPKAMGASCKKRDLFGKGKFVSCILNTCKGKTGEEGDRCVRQDCRAALDNLAKQKPTCAEALMASVGKNKVLAILSLINPLKKAGKFSNKGRVGTLLLSKYPIVESGFYDLQKYSTTVRRGILYSTIKVKNKEVLVTCNHLTANLTGSAPYIGNPPYIGPIKFENGWANENYFQTIKLMELSQLIQDLHSSTRNQKYLPIIHMGDFNCALPNKKLGLHEDFPQSCRRFLKDGYMDLASFKLGECTYCPNNALIEKGKEEDPMILDHIYTKNISTKGAITEIAFKQLVPIEEKKKRIMVNLSDHYGVLVKIPYENIGY